MDLTRFRELPVIGILRANADVPIERVVETVVDAGLETMEITMNTPGAPDLIRRARAIAGDAMSIGAGTVLSVADLEDALSAGARFIVMPTLDREVVSACVREGVPAFPGALTPQEIHDAWRAGATMVKVFPAKFFGPEYFKEIKGPFADIELLACGGVNADNLQDFFAGGASAVAFGGSIFKAAWLAEGRFEPIRDGVATLLQACRRARAA